MKTDTEAKGKGLPYAAPKTEVPTVGEVRNIATNPNPSRIQNYGGTPPVEQPPQGDAKQLEEMERIEAARKEAEKHAPKPTHAKADKEDAKENREKKK